MKHIFIVNPISGNGKGKETAKKIIKICEQKELDYLIHYTNKPGDAITLTRQYKKQQNIIYSVGGDGTLNEVLNGMAETKNMLGIVPAGSGNDFYKVIADNDEIHLQIDIGKINNRYFINVISFGIDAEVAENVRIFKEKNLPRKSIYNASVVYTLLKFKPKDITFVLNKTEKQGKYTIVTICNGRYYGSGYKIAPSAIIDDGLFDIYFVDKMSKLDMLPLILKLKKGNHESSPHVHKRMAESIKIKSKDDIICNVDGEIIIDNKFNVKALTKKITIYNDRKFIDEVLKK